MNAGGISTMLPETGTGTVVSVADESSAKQELESKLQDAREQLLALRRQQDELERQKGELEELRRKQDEYARGKVEMIDNLTRGLVIVEREQLKAQRVAEICSETNTAFRDYLDQVQSLNEENWTTTTIHSELGRALGVIQNSRLEYNRAQTRLECFQSPSNSDVEPSPADKEAAEWQELMRYLRLGAAATAPLILAGSLWVMLLLIFKH
jgi:hypothetical protein